MNTKYTYCKIFVLPLFVMSLALLSGCSGDPVPGKVTGKITLDGEPVKQAIISFYPSSGPSSMARSNDNGEYELLFTDDKKGAVVGTHKVTASTFAPSSMASTTGTADPGAPQIIEAVPEIIPAKYINKETTDIVKEVKSGKQVINIELTSQ
ncbi:MAG: hypothetical protein ACRC2T_02745 [Thermoguttaceae bacterium]